MTIRITAGIGAEPDVTVETDGYFIMAHWRDGSWQMIALHRDGRVFKWIFAAPFPMEVGDWLAVRPPEGSEVHFP